MTTLKRKQLFDSIYRLEFYANWTLGHTNIALQALQTYLLLVAVFHNFIWPALIVVTACALLVLIGYYGVERKGWLKRQTSIANQHNPEIQQLVRRKGQKKCMDCSSYFICGNAKQQRCRECLLAKLVKKRK
jgi:hypothetical protein